MMFHSKTIQSHEINHHNQPSNPMMFPCSNVFFSQQKNTWEAIAWSVMPLSCAAYVFQLLALWGNTDFTRKVND